MPYVRAFRSGNWSDTNLTTSPWSNGTALFIPNQNDLVYSNNNIIQIDQNVKVASITSQSSVSRTWKDGGVGAGTQGGYFNFKSGITFEGTIIGTSVAGSYTSLLDANCNNATIIGALSAGTFTNGSNALTTSSNWYGTLNFTGTIYGGRTGNASYDGYGILINGPGKVNISGFLYGGNSSRNYSVYNNNSFSKIYITGNMYGGETSDCGCIYDASNSTFSIAGNMIARQGPVFRSGSIVGFYNFSVLVFNSLSMNAIYAPKYYINPVPKNGYISIPNSFTTYDTWLAIDSLSAFSMPPISSVRYNTSFANGLLTGTCVIPNINAVSLDVLVDDNKKGISVLNPFDFFKTSVFELTANKGTLGEKLTNIASLKSTGLVAASFTTQ